MAHFAFLPLLLIPFYGVKFDSRLKVAIGFGVLILIIGLITRTAPYYTFLYTQNAIAPFTMYYLVNLVIKEENVIKIYRLMLKVAYIQLPVVIFQFTFADALISLGNLPVSDYDMGFGTFYTANDVSMCLFLIGLVCILLFHPRANDITNHKWLSILWLSLTVLISNSKISVLLMLFIYVFFFLRNMRPKVIVTSVIAGFLLVGLITWLGFLDNLLFNLQFAYEQISLNVDPENAQYFYLTGIGGRPYQLIYHLSQPIQWIGLGPHSYFDPVTHTYFMGGDFSMIFSFYVDLGLIGVIYAYFMAFVFFTYRRVTKITFLFFFAMMLLTITTEVFSDESILMTFHLILASVLILPKNNTSKAEPSSAKESSEPVS